MVHFGKNLKGKDMSKYAIAFQTGKGLNDRVLQNMVTGRKLRKENALFSYYDKKTSIINLPYPEPLTPEQKRRPLPSDSILDWPELNMGSEQVESYWFWGFMRNTKKIVDVSKQKDIPFFFVDHAYLYHRKHSAYRRLGDMENCIYRVVKNNYVINKITDTNETRYLDLKQRYSTDDELDILDWKKDGSHILVFPPSHWLCKMLGLNDEEMLNNSINTLKKYTDREIRVRLKKPDGKYNPVPLEEDLKNCHAVVSFQSSAAAKAIIKGIPSFTMYGDYSSVSPLSLKDLSKIETPIYPENRYEWLCNLANHQFYQSEIQSGYAERYLNEQDA